MLINANVTAVTMRKHLDKKSQQMVDVADVVLMVSEPTDALVLTLWNNSVQKNEHKPYQALIGKDAVIAIRPDVFNGKLQYQLQSSVAPRLQGSVNSSSKV